MACHAPDGKGAPQIVVGFDTPLPDFTDCEFSTAEPDASWVAVVHLGGPARALDRHMPAFGDALSDAEIERTVNYVHGFCRSERWPHGNLNLPRALVTEKAFPENEAFVTIEAPTPYINRVDSRFVYEHRVGARGQYEILVPFSVAHGPGKWNRGLGDIAVAFKQVVAGFTRSSILSAGGEVTFPTGKETEFLGNRLRIFEPFGTYSQILPNQAFLHAQAGFEFPLNIESANNEFYWRAAFGKTFTQSRWGRAWSPMVEVLGRRELAREPEPAFWDVLPELQVTLSRRQHVKLNVGLRTPLNLRRRSSTAMVSVLWDWYEGGLFSGW